MLWCYLYPPRMLFLCPGCQVKMSDCLSHIRKCNLCRDGKKYRGYWSEGKSQVIVTECAQTIVWSGVQSDNYVCTFWYTNQGPWYERRMILFLIIYNFVSWRSNRWIKDQQKVWHQFNFENSNLIKLLTFHVFQKLKSLGIIYEGRLWDSINWAMHFALH